MRSSWMRNRRRRVAPAFATVLAMGVGAVFALTPGADVGSSTTHVTLAGARNQPVTPWGVVDYDNDGKPDLIFRDNPSGNLFFQSGNGVRAANTPNALVQIGNGWNGYTPFGMIDWDRDGYKDILTRNDSNGDLWLYPGQGTRGYSQIPPVKIWAAGGSSDRDMRNYTPYGVGDWDHGGFADLLVRGNTPGITAVYDYEGNGLRAPMSGAGYWLDGHQAGFTPFGAVDFDRDGYLDFIARNDATGDLFLYPGIGHTTYNDIPPVKIGNGWNGWTVFGLADWDRDGNQDIIVRYNANGTLWLYPGQSVRGYSQIPPVQIGSGY